MSITDKDFRDLRDKVNSVSQTQDTIVIPALENIKISLDNLAFVSQKDHDRDMNDIRKEIAQAIEDIRAEVKPTVDQVKRDTILVNAGGLKVTNAVTGKAFGYVVTALAVLLIVGTIIGLASTLPAVQSALGNVQNEKNN